MASTINTANDAARAGDWSACLDALLALWRPERPAELGALIERIGKRVRCDRVDDIPARIATATSTDVTAILARIELQPLDERIIDLSARVGPDPRIATRLAALFEYSPFNRNQGRLDMRLLAALDAIDDTRYRDAIIRVADELALEMKPSRQLRVQKLVATAAAVRLRATPTFALSLTTIENELARFADPELLLDAIYADPTNTATRLVYADALQERGDPRGEFIAMQCSETRSEKRERELIHRHGREWSGAIESHVRGVTFSRGFPATARLAFRAAPPCDREWQLLEAIDLDLVFGEPLARFVASMRGLRRVARLWASDARFFTEPLPWRSFGVREANTEFAHWFMHNRALLPQLEELDLSASIRPSECLIGLGDLASLRVRVAATMQEHVNYLLERNATIVVVPRYEFQLGSFVEIAHGVARTNDATFLDSLKSIIPRSIKISGTRLASTGRPAP